jgi:hypothetical protein
MIIKRWNGSAYDELYPVTTVGRIIASGSPSSSNWLRGDSTWNAPTAAQVGAQPTNNPTFTGVLAAPTITATATTASTTTGTGSLRTAGGLGVAGAINAGTYIRSTTGGAGAIALGDVASTNRIQASNAGGSVGNMRFLNHADGFASVGMGSLNIGDGAATDAGYGNLNVQNIITGGVNNVSVDTSDQILIADFSDNNRIKRANISFGANDGTFLRKDGTWQTPAGGGGSSTVGFPGHVIKPANGLYISTAIGPTLTTQAMTTNTMVVVPFVPNYDFTSYNFGFSVSTGATGNVRGVVYNSDVNGRPTTLRHVTSDNQSTASPGTYTLAWNVSFTAGTTYWIGVWVSGTATIRATSTGTMPITWSTAATPAPTSVLRRTLTYNGTLDPSDWTYASGDHVAAVNAPLILMSINV